MFIYMQYYIQLYDYYVNLYDYAEKCYLAAHTSVCPHKISIPKTKQLN